MKIENYLLIWVMLFFIKVKKGYIGEKKTHPSSKTGRLEIFSYLNGDVVHYKVNQEGHGATRKVTEDQLMRFLKTKKP